MSCLSSGLTGFLGIFVILVLVVLLGDFVVLLGDFVAWLVFTLAVLVEVGFLRPVLAAGLVVAAVLDVGAEGRVAVFREVAVVLGREVAVVLGREVAVVLGREVAVVLGREVIVLDRVAVVVLGREATVLDREVAVLDREVVGDFAVVTFEAGGLESADLATGLAAALVVVVVAPGFLLTAVALGIADLVALGRVRGDETVVFGLAAVLAPPSVFLAASVAFGLPAATLVSFFASISRLL